MNLPAAGGEVPVIRLIKHGYPDLTNLTALVIRGNTSRRLADLNLPQGLTTLETLDIDNNVLSHVILPAGMKSLFRLSLPGNELTNLRLPAKPK
jgi:Leucine-rich repeat (LRR) protein